MGREDFSKTSRGHKMWRMNNLTFVAGGKYTTYRKMAYQIVNSLLDQLPFEARLRIKPANTKVPLNEATSRAQMQQALCHAGVWAQEFKLSEAEVEALARQYGMEAGTILDKFGRHYKDTLSMEAAFHIENTMCSGLIDFYRRRTSLFLGESNNGMHQSQRLATVFADRLGWSDSTKEQKLQELKSYQEQELAGLW